MIEGIQPVVENMRKHEFVILCLRLLGIYILVIGLGSLFSQLGWTAGDATAKLMVLGPVFYIMAGGGLIGMAPRLSTYILVMSEPDEGFELPLTERTTRTALLIMGIYIFTITLPHLVQLAFDTGLYYKNAGETPSHLREADYRWVYLIGPTLKLLLSIGLILGPDKVLGLLSRYDVSFKKLTASRNRSTQETD